MLKLNLIVFVVLLFLGCGNSNSSNTESVSTTTTSTKEIYGTDVKISTKFETEKSSIKIPDSLSVYEGKVYKSGSEPFTKLGLYLSDEKVFFISGDKIFMEYADKNQGSMLKVAGRSYKELDQNWIKVYFVLKTN